VGVQKSARRDGEKIRVVAIEDDSRYRASLEALFRHSPPFQFVRSFASPQPVLRGLEQATRRGRPAGFDLVLMDLQLPGMSGVEATRRIKELCPALRVVALTVYEGRSTILEAICAGVDGYLLKRTPAERLVGQLRSVLAGGAPLSPSVARSVLEFVRRREADRDGAALAGDPHLTPREQEVLACLVTGMSYKQVARDLDISLDTVRFHIRNVYGKLQVRNVAQAVSRALREGLV
jgi:DNA-binding NarL/FixJ family response regulator